MNPLISIIVPCYKVEPYLRRCLESILAQTYCYWEAILVDDGSPDLTGDICDEYARIDSRIKVVHKQNEGVSYARKSGVFLAKGEWITMVDGDDTIPPDALSSYASLIDDTTDIIIGSVKDCIQNNKPYSHEEYLLGCISGQRFPSAPWCHLYRASLFSDFIFDTKPLKKGADVLMNIRLAYCTPKEVKTTSNITYHYLTNPMSVVHTFKSTMDYEQLYHQYRLSSIPKEDQHRYAKAITLTMLNGVKVIALREGLNTDWMDHPYLQELKEAIRVSSFSLTIWEKELLSQRNHYLRRFILLAYKIDRKIRKKRYEYTLDVLSPSES